MLEVIERIDANAAFSSTFLYLDCNAETLLRRFSETRRRHPASPNGSPISGIEQEIATLSRLRDHADILVDTSELSPHQLRAELSRWFDPENGEGLSVSVQSFSYKRGTPRGVDMMIDCRFLRNPHWEPTLRPLTGLAPAVADYVQADPLFDPFFEKLVDMLALLLPAYQGH